MNIWKEIDEEYLDRKQWETNFINPFYNCYYYDDG
jgi:hypothetical protein